LGVRLCDVRQVRLLGTQFSAKPKGRTQDGTSRTGEHPTVGLGTNVPATELSSLN
jgi:hypothetical protein